MSSEIFSFSNSEFEEFGEFGVFGVLEFEEMKLPEVSDFSKKRQAPLVDTYQLYLVGVGKYVGRVGIGSKIWIDYRMMK